MMVDSLVEAVIMEPERFLSYISNWDNIKSIEDFVKAVYKSFGAHWVGRNIFRSNEVKTALNILWKDKITQDHVKKNLNKENATKKEIKREISKRKAEKLYYEETKGKVDKRITVTMKNGKTYTKSRNPWSEREEQWLSKNKNMKTSVLTELYNLIFKPRTKASISSKKSYFNKKGM